MPRYDPQGPNPAAFRRLIRTTTSGACQNPDPTSDAHGMKVRPLKMQKSGPTAHPYNPTSWAGLQECVGVTIAIAAPPASVLSARNAGATGQPPHRPISAPLSRERQSLLRTSAPMTMTLTARCGEANHGLTILSYSCVPIVAFGGAWHVLSQ